MGSTSSDRAFSVPQQDEYIGRKLADRYAFTRILGTGGTGTVYLCEDQLLRREVAVKTILPALVDNLEVQRRIDRECRLHAAIGAHPNIVTLYDKIEQDGKIFLVMEYVRGEVLSDILKKKPETNEARWMVNDVVSLIQQLLQAIGCIHGHGILHRDIKTSNILIWRSEKNNPRAKLMDFGIARMEEDGEALTQLDTSGPGTPTYMAPERIDPQKFGESCPAGDLYSVGIILYQLLSDGPPFRGTVSEIFNGHLHKPIDLTRLKNDISADLKHILIKALAKNPKERFADAASFAQALAKITKPISFSSMHSDQGEELTLPVTVSSNPHEVESTLLAPEPRNRDTQSPGTGRSRRYFFFFAVGLACCFLVGLSIYSFIKITADAPQPSETAAGTSKLKNRQKTEAITSLPVSIQNNTQTPTTAMDALQESRSTTGRSGQNGLTIENRIHAQQAPENSEWKIIESSASRIDKK